MSNAESYLRSMANNGQMDLPQYGILAGANSTMRSEPIGGENWQSAAQTSLAQMNQVDDINAANGPQEALTDSDFAAVCPDCAPREPCCLRELKVEDADDASRNVIWPVEEGAPKRLYVVAKDPYAGRPSAKAKVTLTDFNPCHRGYALPKAVMIGSADHDNQGILSSGDITVTTPFLMPAFYSALLPPQAMTVIYLCGLLVMAKTYREHGPAQVNPSQSMIPTARGVEVMAIPHASFNAQMQGRIGASFSLTRMPTFSAGCSIDIEGEVGNQSITYSGSAGIVSRERSVPEQGPINHPLFDFLDKIQSSMDSVSANQSHNPFNRTVSQTGNGALGLDLSLTVAVGISNIAIEPKSGSPNLELVVDPFHIRLNPGITGTIDLLGLLLRYVPGGGTIRRTLARDGNAVRAQAYFEITISGDGEGAFEVLSAATIELCDSDELEAEFDKIGLQFTASLELTGTIEAKLEVELNTWIISAYASAGVSARTGWNFGGRAIEQDGTTKWQKMYGFQGLIVSGYAEAGVGTRVEVEAEETFGNDTDPTEIETSSSDGTAVRSNVGENSFTAILLEPAGDGDTWYDV
ncbi:hypothetical protein [Nereida sp. MMG025]|uniref:hypothetical protein n=1 Tax=Nereida sp. MMG025 TaxID=2909981 RepID=UPI001F18FB29|nr:hypothetical protein [Nereida sp. MMG025]MCF6445739.1 hypothetical protein [Nereida sp. MMG025]